MRWENVSFFYQVEPCAIYENEVKSNVFTSQRATNWRNDSRIIMERSKGYHILLHGIMCSLLMMSREDFKKMGSTRKSFIG